MPIKNPEARRKWHRDWCERNPGYMARARWKNRGMDPFEAEAVLAGATVCELHGGADRPLVPDHDHKTGKIRGALCGVCNMALGTLGDTKDALEGVVRYLGKSLGDHVSEIG